MGPPQQRGPLLGCLSLWLDLRKKGEDGWSQVTRDPHTACLEQRANMGSHHTRTHIGTPAGFFRKDTMARIFFLPKQHHLNLVSMKRED